MKRKFLILLIIIAISTQAIFILSKLLGASKSKIVIAQKIEEKINAKTEIKGKIKLQFFPRPKFIISHLRIYDYKLGSSKLNIRASSFEASLPVLSLLRGDVNFKEILINNAKIEYQDNIQSANIIKDISKKNLPYEKINIAQSDLIIIQNEKNVEFKDFELSLTNNFNLVKITGGLTRGESFYNFTANVNKFDNQDFAASLLLDFNGGKLELESKYAAQNKEHYGNISITGNDIKKLVFYNMFSNWFFFPDKIKSSYQISFDYSKKNNDLSLENGEISGDSVKGTFSGLINKTQIGNLSFNITELNLDEIFTTYKKDFIKEEMAYMKINQGSFLNHNNNILLSVTIDKLLYKENEVGPLELNISLNQYSNVTLDELKFKISEDNNNILSGYFDKNKDDKYKFIGDIASSGQDVRDFIQKISKFNFFTNETHSKDSYEVNAKIELSEDIFNLNNINGYIGNSSLQGKIRYSALEDEASEISLKFNELDFNDFLILTSKEKKRHIIHFLYEKLANREAGSSLLQKFLWLRNIFGELKLSIDFKDAIYNQEKLDYFSIRANLRHRFLEINDIAMISENNRINSSILVNLDNNTPEVKIHIDSDFANLDFLDYQKQYQEVKDTWSKDFIKFPNFDNIDFSFKSSFKELRYHDLAVKTSNFNFVVKNNILNIEDFSGDIDEGVFKVQGNFIMDGLPQISLTYNLEKFNIGNFLNFFFNINNIKANTNLVGSLQSYGNTPFILVRQLKSKNKYIISNIEVDHLALPKIIQDIADMSSNPQSKFQRSIEQEISDGSTRFKKVKGEFNIVNGVVLLSNLNLSLDGLEAALAGKIDLVNKLIKINSIVKFIVHYKSYRGIQKTALTITHTLDRDFNNTRGKYDLFQLESFINNLKDLYIKAYNELEQNKKE